jgi:hypothetical protein
VKTSSKRSYSVIKNERFGLVFAKTGSIISGNGKFWGNWYVVPFKTVPTIYFLEIYGIPYMKKVTEFHEIPRDFTELYYTEFGGIPPEF